MTTVARLTVIFLLGSAIAAQAQITGRGASEEISRLNQPRYDSIIANGVDTGTGNFSTSASIVSFEGGTTVDFSINYDSIQIPSGIVSRRRILGQGWTHPYAARIEGNPLQSLEVYWDDNRRNTFRNDGNGTYTPVDEAVRHDKLVTINGTQGCGDCEFRVTRQDGTRYDFDDVGRLRLLANKIGQRLEISYNADGTISRINEPIANKDLAFTYNQVGRIQYLTDPADRRTYFLYNAEGRLRAVNFPAALSERFGQAFVPMDIPDNSPQGLELSIEVTTGEPVGLVIIEPGNLDHADPSQLQILLESPSGTVVDVTALAERPSANNLNFPGTAVDGFHGENPQGTWRLHVIDTAPGATGRLNGWQMHMTGLTYPMYFNYVSAMLVSATDVDGQPYYENVYDSQGRMARQFDGRVDTPAAQFSYAESAVGVVTTYTNRLGDASTYEHDRSYHLTRFADALQAETLFTYNQNGDRVSLTDALGRTTTLTYDQNGNVASLTDPALFTSRMNYDSNNNLTSFTDARGKSSSFSYNGRNNVQRINDALGNVDQKTYNGNGQLVGNMLQDGAGVDYGYTNGMPTSGRRRGASGGKQEEADYDPLGRPTRMQSAEGGEVFIEYDNRGLVTKRTDPLGNVETTEYDNRGRRTSVTDNRGNTTNYNYDGNGNLTSRINALGEMVEFEYDEEGRVVAVTDAEDNQSTREYDASGRLIGVTDALGNRTRHQYDSVGNMTATIAPDGTKVNEILYDDRDLPISVRDATGEAVLTTYDANQRPAEFTDPLGRTTQFTYDDLGRLTSVTAPGGRTVAQSYLSDDVVQTITDAEGHESRFRYDDFNHVTQTQGPEGTQGAPDLRYDESGKLTREDLPGDGQRDYEYDDKGQITAIRYSGTGAQDDVEFAYDPNGNRRVVSVVRNGSATPQITRGFDALDRVTSFTDAHGDTITYAYDANGNVIRIGYPGTGSVNYTYDAAKRLIKVTDWANRETDFTYDENSHITRIDFPNGTSRLMDYDAAGRIIRRREMALPARLIFEYEYSYARDGNLATTQGGLPSPRYNPSSSTASYRFDGRLDAVNGINIGYDPRNNLTTAPLNGQAANFSFDLNNNMTMAAGFARRYDGEDRLIAWSSAAGETRLTLSPHGGALTQLLIKRDPNGSRTRYVYGLGLLYEERSDGIRVIHYDQQGNAVAYTGDNGEVTGTVAYSPYGEKFATTGTVDSVFQFGAIYGVMTDPNGLNYMRFRWYSPQLKRFLSRDAHFGDLGNPATLNRYIYAGNNPINFADPSGEFLAIIGAVVGAVVNVVATVVVGAVTGEGVTAGDILGAAVSGALVGGGLALCGPGCAGLGAQVALGVAAGIAGNALGQGLDIITGEQEGIDAASFGAQIATDAIFSAIPFGRGAKGLVKGAARGAGGGVQKGARSSVSKALRQAVTPSPSGSIPVPAPKIVQVATKGIGPGGVAPIAGFGYAAAEGAASAAAKTTAKAVPSGGFGEAARSILGDTALAIGAGFFQGALQGGIQAVLPGSDSVRISGRREINAGQRYTHGEFRHWKFYEAAHAIAGRALPNNPNSPLAQF